MKKERSGYKSYFKRTSSSRPNKISYNTILEENRKGKPNNTSSDTDVIQTMNFSNGRLV